MVFIFVAPENDCEAALGAGAGAGAGVSGTSGEQRRYVYLPFSAILVLISANVCHDSSENTYRDYGAAGKFELCCW